MGVLGLGLVYGSGLSGFCHGEGGGYGPVCCGSVLSRSGVEGYAIGGWVYDGFKFGLIFSDGL